MKEVKQWKLKQDLTEKRRNYWKYQFKRVDKVLNLPYELKGPNEEFVRMIKNVDVVNKERREESDIESLRLIP